MRRRNNDPCVRFMFTCQISNGRRRNDACTHGNPTRRTNPRRKRCLEHLARDTRIASNQNTWARICTLSKIKRCRAPQMIRQLRSKICICLPTHAIRSKKPNHKERLLLIHSRQYHSILYHNSPQFIQYIIGFPDRKVLPSSHQALHS